MTLCLKTVCSQQSLNLDFEKISSEGYSRPWGWSYDSAAPYSEAVLDSTIYHAEKFSLSLSGKKDTVKRIGVDIEPYSLKGNQIKLSGWIKTKAFAGTALLSLNYTIDSAGHVYTKTESIKCAADNGDWKDYSIATKVPAEAKSVFISLEVIGEGNVWFDDLSLYVNGKRISDVEVAPSFTKSQIEWMKAHSQPLKSVDASTTGIKPEFSDLQLFGKLAWGAQIIALGESTHGTSEFFKLKNRLLEYVVYELGVRVFALEDNMLIVERVNNFVLNGVGKARGSMWGMFSVWQNQEVLDLIKWVRAYNEKHPEDKVSFVGFDMQNPTQAFDSLSAYLGRKDKLFQQRSDSLLKDMRVNWQNSWNVSDSIKSIWFTNAKTIQTECESQSKVWLSNAKTKLDSIQIQWGLQYANLVKQYAENTVKGHMSLYRDIAMAENISWILSMHKPGTKMVVWAHDNHISRGDHSTKEYNYYNGISMGSHLSKKYGNTYKAFGLYTYSGDYWAQISYMNFKQIKCPLYPGPRGTLDEALHQVTVQNKSIGVLLDLKAAKKEDWLTKLTPVRFANHVCMEYSYWTRFSVPYQFDGLFFIDNTSSAKPAANK